MTTQTSAPRASVPEHAAEVVAAAAKTVDGVHALGRSIERTSRAVRERVGLTRIVPGVKVEMDREGPARAAVSIVVDYPHKLREVSDAVREASRGALNGIGLERVDIDVRVTDVWGPFDTEIVAEDVPDGADAEDTTPAPPHDGAADTRIAASASGQTDAAERAASAPPAAAAVELPASGSLDGDTKDEVLAETLSDVAEALAHAAEDVRTRRSE